MTYSRQAIMGDQKPSVDGLVAVMLSRGLEEINDEYDLFVRSFKECCARSVDLKIGDDRPSKELWHKVGSRGICCRLLAQGSKVFRKSVNCERRGVEVDEG